MSQEVSINLLNLFVDLLFGAQNLSVSGRMIKHTSENVALPKIHKTRREEAVYLWATLNWKGEKRVW